MSSPSSSALPFPDGDIVLTVEAAWGADLTADPATWTFTDLSARVIDTPITISHGVLVGAGQSKSGSVSGLTLLNDDGWLTPFLATSPWWPYVDAGTPVRVALQTHPDEPVYVRAEMYIADVQPTFRQLSDGDTHSVVQMRLGGVGTRLERLEAPAWSPLRRSIQQATVPPVAYWPLEDKSGATSGASAFEDQPAMVTTGPVVFSFDLGETDDDLIPRYGTSALASLAAGAKLSAPVPVTATTAWTVSFEHQSHVTDIGGGVTAVRLLEWVTPGGTHQRWALVGTTTGYQVRAYDDVAGTVTNVVTTTPNYPQLIHYSVTATVSGGNINVALLGNALTLGSGSVAGTITQTPSRVTVNPDQANTTASTSPWGIRFLAGHVTVHNQVVVALPYYADGTFTIRSDRGWAYEQSHERSERLCDEERIPFRLVGAAPTGDEVTRLNAQREDPFQVLLTKAVDSESGGLLLEGEFGYLHVPRVRRYNSPVDLTIDMATYRYTGGTNPEDVLVPRLDARGPNAWTVERTGGSAATRAAPAAYRQRRGTVRAEAVLDVLYDSDTIQHASWRVHLGVDGQDARYPNATVDLAANPDLIDDWVSCRIGSRVQRTNQPTIAGLGVIDQVIDGITETIGRRSWTATLDTSPAQVWDVGVYDSEEYLLDSATTTLAADVSSSAQLLGFSSTAVGDLWTTSYVPFDVSVGGQTNTVRWMSQAGSAALLDGGFETGVTGWGTTGCAVTQSSAFARTGTYSARIVGDGTTSAVSIFPTVAWPVTASVGYTATLWLYATTSVSNVRLLAAWYTFGGAFISSTLSSSVTLSAGVWTLFTASATSPGTAAGVRVSPQITGSPANGTTIYVDDLDIVRDSAGVSGAGPYLQQAAVTRDPVVTKSLSAGEPIHVATPLRWAL
jgi:hypothetical protein